MHIQPIATSDMASLRLIFLSFTVMKRHSISPVAMLIAIDITKADTAAVSPLKKLHSRGNSMVIPIMVIINPR
jgi:hypothetical protein